MPDLSDWRASLPLAGKFNIYCNGADDKYNPGGKALRLQITIETVAEYAQHLMDLADDPKNHKMVNFYDWQAKTKKEAPAIEIYHKGKASQEDDEGWFGSINPGKFVEPESNSSSPSDMPF